MESAYDRIEYYEFGQEEKARLTARLKTALAKDKRIKLAILFGSFTRRNYARDIDLAIHAIPDIDFKQLLNLNAEIELKLGIPIDIVELARVPTSLKIDILKNGALIKGT